MRTLQIKETKLKDLLLIEPEVVPDANGFTLGSYHQKAYEEAGIAVDFIQDIYELTRSAGILRGLEYQVDEFAQSRLIQVTRGKIFQVAVDLRAGSPSYGQWEGFYLSEHNKHMLFIPKGFAHGYLTLTGDVNVIYKVDQYNNSAKTCGLNFACPTLDIEWNYDECMLFTTLKIEAYPTFDQFEKTNPFKYE